MPVPTSSPVPTPAVDRQPTPPLATSAGAAVTAGVEAKVDATLAGVQKLTAIGIQSGGAIDRAIELAEAQPGRILAEFSARLDSFEAAQLNAQQAMAQEQAARARATQEAMQMAAKMAAKAAEEAATAAVQQQLQAQVATMGTTMQRACELMIESCRVSQAEMVKTVQQLVESRISETMAAAVRAELPPIKAEIAGLSGTLGRAAERLEESLRTDDLAARTAVLVAQQVEEKLSAKLEREIKPAVEATVAGAMLQISTATSALPSAVSAQVAAGVNGQVSSAFRGQFAEVLVPGYERASAAMFEQLREAFGSGLAEFKTEWQASTAEMVQQSVEKASSAVNESMLARAAAQNEMLLSKAAKELAVAKVDASSSRPPKAKEKGKQAADSQPPAASPNVPHRAAPPPPKAVQSTPPPASAAAVPKSPGSGIVANFAATMELQALVGQGAIERAFATALGLNDLAILIWLCGKVEPKALATGPMPSLILVTLIQQLGEELQSDSKIKLVWLKEALAHLNPHDAQIAGSVGRVLSQLRERLETASEVLGDGALAADIAMLTFMVNKLCR